MKSIYKDGGMNLMFIKDVDAEVKMFLGERYVEVKDYPKPHSTPILKEKMDKELYSINSF